MAGKSGVIPIRRDGGVQVVALSEVIAETRRVPQDLYELSRIFS
jgi:hypothetical protein